MKIFLYMWCSALFSDVFGMEAKKQVEPDVPLANIIFALQLTQSPVSKKQKAIIHQKFVEEQQKLNAVMYPKVDHGEISPYGDQKDKTD